LSGGCAICDGVIPALWTKAGSTDTRRVIRIIECVHGRSNAWKAVARQHCFGGQCSLKLSHVCRHQLPRELASMDRLQDNVDLLSSLHASALPILREHGYFPEWCISGPGRAALICKPRDAVCYYFVLKSRSRTVSADCWVAPASLPDDRLQALPQVRIAIGECYDFGVQNDEFLKRVAERQARLTQHLAGIADVIEQELRAEHAAEGTRARRLAFEAYQQLHQCSALAAGEQLTELCRIAGEVAAGRVLDDHLSSACVPLVKRMRDEIVCLNDPVFQGKARVVATFLAPLFYVDAVVTTRP
jgi:hypothetical protein